MILHDLVKNVAPRGSMRAHIDRQRRIYDAALSRERREVERSDTERRIADAERRKADEERCKANEERRIADAERRSVELRISDDEYVKLMFPQSARLGARPKLTTADIREAVCTHYRASMIDLKSQRRIGQIVFVRHVMFYMLREMTGCSLPQIGRMFGNRDHSTVLHGANKIARMRILDAKFCAELAEIESRLQEMGIGVEE